MEIEILLPVFYKKKCVEIEARILFEVELNHIQVCLNNAWVDFKRHVSGGFKLAQELFLEVDYAFIRAVEDQINRMFI